MKNAPLVATCRCEHAGMHHTPHCKVLHCACPKFKHGTVKRLGDASWMKKTRATRRRVVGDQE